MKKLTLWLLTPLLLLGACGGGGGAPAMVHAPPTAAEPVPVSDDEEPAGLARPDDEAGSESDTGDAPGDPAAVTDDDFALAGYGPPPVAAAGSAIAPAALAAPDDAAPALGSLAAGSAPALYVSPHGNDTHAGTRSRPLRSLVRAARTAGPGTRVYVAPGTYSGGVRTLASGTAGGRISFISSTRWGARIVPASNSRTRIAWDNRGSYIDIVGFDIDGSAHRGGIGWTHGIYSGGSYASIRNNRVHHIAQSLGCTRAGGAAIGVDSYFRGIKADVIANLVHDIGPPGCRFVQGIYVSTSGRIRNNVVYRVAEAGIHLWHDAAHVSISNNTVTSSNTGIIIGGGNFYHSQGPNDHTAVHNNIVYDNRMGISEQGRTGTNNTYRNNLVFQNASFNWRLKNGLTHKDTVAAPPRFVAGTGSTPNVKLAPGSPAIGRATPVHAESTDFDGKPRNAAAGFDIGAFQH